jgi:kynurenine formamidase
MIPKIRKMLDLSQDIYHLCPGWHTHRPTKLDYDAVHCYHDYTAERIEMSTHSCTHSDAPFHFLENGISIDKIDLRKFQGRGIVLDLRDIRSAVIEKRHLEKYSSRVQPGDIVLLYTGWAQKRALTKEYVREWPYLTGESAQWLVDKGIKCVGVDTMSVGGYPAGSGNAPHLCLLKNEIAIVEELYMDERLFEEDEWYIIALPLKVRDAGGAPTRVIAVTFE